MHRAIDDPRCAPSARASPSWVRRNGAVPALLIWLACLVPVPAQAADASTDAVPQTAAQPRRAHFGNAQASAQARHVAHWAVDSGDHRGLPFVVVDKHDARVFVFDAAGRLLGATAALLGSASGDDSVPGIGTRKMSSIGPHERTTPAGRFEISLARSAAGDEILWIDYDTAIALHRVITTSPRERRLQRLQSDSARERRITYGCINVPVAFYEAVVSPAFARTAGVAYVLPETRPVHLVFGSYEVALEAGVMQAPGNPPR